MNDFTKVALVTGATGGIGQAIAKKIASDGYIVFVHYSGNEEKAAKLIEEIVDAGGKACLVQADVTNALSVMEMFDTVRSVNGELNVVVHSAGIMPMARIEPENLDAFKRVIDTNLIGTFLVLAHAAKCVSSGGRIIALSSSVVAKNFPQYGPYIASKEGVEGLIRVLANELKGKNITVNGIAPGPTGTDLFFKGKSEDLINWFKDQNPMNRIGTPEDIANGVSALAGDLGRWINGQVIRVNGGFA
ncbi:3-ketoacyl-ACP reductase [Pantoea sp. ICBG 1758]|uniref:SDR family oxidoreductase n=1 Tax=Pantoea sp. ICBG 1758 TaxID=2071682 RepID=UPI000CE545FE|nr:SDR family oxidoreductase [Pantoea sp. ICBG 1758]PPC63827.1 3-ketoacyl-ACP reductase [Pantoea sp. ICBG 1758]